MSGDGKIASQLTEITGSSNFLGEGPGLEAFGIDGFSPKWAIFPKTREEIKEIIGVCQIESLSIIPRGSGTKMDRGGVPRRADLVISTKNLNRVVEQDCENLTITLETGTLLSNIQERLRQEGIGYFIPLDPPYTEAATLGGILATNSNGPKRLLYGTARDLVLGMKVILADGKSISCGGKTVKNVSGYDMTKLFIGSFGTLGIIIEATLRLFPLPEREQTLMAAFPKLEDSFEVVKEILKSQLVPSSLELLSPRAMKEIGGNLLPGGANYFLVIGIEGVSEAVKRQAREIRKVCSRFEPQTVEVLEGNDQDHLWKGIRDSSLKLKTRYPQSIILKTNVPISKIPLAFSVSEAIVLQEGLICALSSHAGTGILHAALLLDEMRTESDRVVKTIRQLTEKAVEMGGNLVVETAPVLIKKQVSVWGREGSDTPIFRQLKSQLDPSSLFNPGKFVGGL